MKQLQGTLRAIWVLWAVAQVGCEATAYSAQVQRNPNKLKQIQSLSLESGPLVTKVFQQNGIPNTYAQVHGTFTHPSARLLFQLKAIPKGNSFSIWVPLSGPATEFELKAVFPRGETLSEKLHISWPEYAPVAVKASSRPSPKRFSLRLAPFVGTGAVTFADPRILSITEMTLQAGVNAQGNFVETPWSINTNVMYSGLPFLRSGTESVQYLSYDVRFGYSFSMGARSKLVLYLGANGLNLFPLPDNLFGFTNIIGPEIFPAFSTVLENGNALSIYGKFCPILNGLGFLNLNNRELLLGATYALTAKKPRPLLVSAEVMMLQLQLTGVTMNLNSYSLRLGMLF